SALHYCQALRQNNLRTGKVTSLLIFPERLSSGERTRLACWRSRPRDLGLPARCPCLGHEPDGVSARAPKPAREPRPSQEPASPIPATTALGAPRKSSRTLPTLLRQSPPRLPAAVRMSRWPD